MNEITRYKKEVERLRNKISNMWTHTEQDLDDLSKVGLKKQIGHISQDINELVGDISHQIESFKNPQVCSHCETDQVSVCEPCLEDMEEKL